jgi:hypothetical protein
LTQVAAPEIQPGTTAAIIAANGAAGGTKRLRGVAHFAGTPGAGLV